MVWCQFCLDLTHRHSLYLSVSRFVVAGCSQSLCIFNDFVANLMLLILFFLFSCSMAEKPSSTSSFMHQQKQQQQHEQQQPQQHCCEICGKSGLTDDIMRDHMKSCHIDGTAICPFCGMSGVAPAELLLHVNQAHLDYLTPENELMSFIDDQSPRLVLRV